MRERMCNVGSCRAIKPAEMLLTVRVEPLSFQSSHWKLTHFISKGSKFLKKKTTNACSANRGHVITSGFIMPHQQQMQIIFSTAQTMQIIWAIINAKLRGCWTHTEGDVLRRSSHYRNLKQTSAGSKSHRTAPCSRPRSSRQIYTAPWLYTTPASLHRTSVQQ